MVTLKRFDICSVILDPTIGSELQKVRPCVVISPNSMNLSRLNTVIIAPLSSTIRENFPTRILIEFQMKKGQVALDQLCVIDRARVTKILGTLSDLVVQNKLLQTLQVMFS